MDRIKELIVQFSQEPLAANLQATLEALEDGSAMVSAFARDDLLIASGIVQGGVTAIIADYAGVYAAMTKIPAGLTPAVRIELDLFKPIRRGERFFAQAEVVGESKGSIRTEVGVWVFDGPQVAVARIVFAKPKP